MPKFHTASLQAPEMMMLGSHGTPPFTIAPRRQLTMSCNTGAVTLTCDMATRAPVKYRVAETGVYAPRLRPRRSARRPQKPKRLERKGNQRWPDLEAPRRVKGSCEREVHACSAGLKHASCNERFGIGQRGNGLGGLKRVSTTTTTTNRWTRGMEVIRLY
nr:hypothetical protein [Candidatus Sigynarchaeota archaeon]